jgi:large subunit ribosomal protein L24
MRIQKNDIIQITVGKDRGKTGRVLKVSPKQNTILAEGLNVYKKHIRPKRDGEKGEIVIVSRPIAISNVMVYCSSCKKGVRVGYKDTDKKTKIRICKTCSKNV